MRSSISESILMRPRRTVGTDVVRSDRVPVQTQNLQPIAEKTQRILPQIVLVGPRMSTRQFRVRKYILFVHPPSCLGR